MANAVKTLAERVRPQKYEIGEFWDVAQRMLVEEYKEHGSAWAIQYIIYKENKDNMTAKELQNEQMKEPLAKCVFMGFSSLSVDETVPDYFSEELFDQPLVKALLVDVRNMHLLLPEKFAG
jgi:hypothetical protein